MSVVKPGSSDDGTSDVFLDTTGDAGTDMTPPPEEKTPISVNGQSPLTPSPSVEQAPLESTSSSQSSTPTYQNPIGLQPRCYPLCNQIHRKHYQYRTSLLQ